MLITVTLLLVTLVGFAALAFDVGHIMIVRNELQNGADASALAGANCLNKRTALSGTDCEAALSPTVNWATASTKATNSIRLNKSDNTVLIDGTVTTGYWNVNGGTTMQPTSLSPLGPCTVAGGVMTTPCDRPAVMVTLSRASGSNGGPVGTLIASMFGGAAVPISARSVAVISSPSNVLPNNLLPVAINKCLFDLYWNYATASPLLATSTSLNGVPQVIGTPWQLRIGSAYHYGTCTSGQWTSFDLNVNSASAINNLIVNGNPTPLAIGANTWIQPGTQTSNYKNLDDKYPTPSPNPPLSPVNDVTLVLVDVPDLTIKGPALIVAFAGFHITDVKGGSDKYVQGNFVKATIVPGGSGAGPSFGAYTPPRLAQ